MKLRLPNKLVAAVMAAATPVLFSTLSTATVGIAALAAAGQQAHADYVIDPDTNICTITGTQEYVPEAMGTDAEDGTVAQFTLSENAIFIATGDQFGWGNNTTLARSLVMNSGSVLQVNADSNLTGHRQIGNATLLGNATIEVNGNVGLNASQLAQNTLALDGHTLNLTRSESATAGNEFRLTNTAVTGGGTINIGSGVKMTTTDDRSYTNAFTLDGTGTFDIGTRKSLGSISLAETWQGTIRISNTSFNGENLNGLTNSASVLELSNITGGHLSQWQGGDSNPTTTNFRLVKTLNGSGQEIAAWVYSNGSSDQQTWNVFTGSWTGDGMFKKINNYQESFRWKGDISGWTGSFVTTSGKKTGLEILNNTSIAASFTNSGTAEMSLTINNSGIASGTATTLSGNISNTGTGSTTLTAFTNGAAVSFNGTVSGLGTITLNGRAANSSNTLTFSNLVTASAGTELKTSYHGGTFNVTKLSGEGDLTLNMAAASTAQARLFINGAGDTAFSGNIVLNKTNDGNGRSGVVVLNHATVAQNSEFRTVSTTGSATLALGVNVANAKLAGINDGTMAANTLTIYSGAESKNNNATNTLELTGTGEYSTEATVQNVNLLISNSGTHTFTGDFSAFNKNITVKGGGHLKIEGTGAVSAAFLSVGGTNSSATFDRAVTLSGGTRNNIGYENNTGTGNEVYFKQGVTYSGSNAYAFVVGGSNNTLKLGGTSDMGGKAIGVSQNGNLILEENAQLTNVGNILNSTSNNFANNGIFTLKEGSVLQFSQEARFVIGTLNNAGTILVKKTGEGAAPVLSIDNAFANQETAGDSTHTVNLGAVALDNGELKNNSSYETAVRNISTLTVDGASALTQNSWNTFWNIGSLNKGTAEGDRTLTWSTSTNHWSNSVLSLTDAGDFDGTLLAKRTYDGSGNPNHGAYQGYVEISHADALKNAVLETNGINTAYMTVALNADTIKLAGLQGNANSIMIAGGANKNYGSSSSSQGKVTPTSTGTSHLVITNKDNATDVFSGKVESGISITKGGSGTQTFDGDLSSFNGSLTATEGTLKIAAGTINTSGLHANGGTIASENGAIIKIGNMGSNNQLTIGANGGFSIAGSGKLEISNWWSFNMAALNEETAATMKATGDTADYAFNRSDITISNAKVTYTGESPTVAHKMTDSAVVKQGAGTLVLTNEANTLVSIHAEGGDIIVTNAENSAETLKQIDATGGNVTLQNLNEATLSLTELSINEGKTVSALTDANAHADGDTNVATIKIAAQEGTLTVNGGTLNANLSVGNEATLTFSNSLTMGCTVSLGAGEHFVLTNATVNNGVLENYVLFTGVEGLTLNGAPITGMGWYDATDLIGSITANGVTLDTTDHSYVIGYWNGTVSIAESTVPEPATATLSLLALAALAARRKRK